MEKYRHVSARYDKTRNQLHLLNVKIEVLATRLDRAIKDNNKSFQFSLCLQMSTVEGLREMYMAYAVQMMAAFTEVFNELLEFGIIPEDLDLDDDVDFEDV